jgi:drug/metabolite transporter (DMT)-like permease
MSPAHEEGRPLFSGLALAATILLWAASFPAIKVALAAYTPAGVAFVRYLIAALLLGGYALARRAPLPQRRDLPRIALCGFTGFTLYNTLAHAPAQATLAGAFLGLFPGVIAYACWSYVLSRIPAGRAGSYLAVIPVVALVISWLWLGETPAPFALAGSLIVFAGVLLVNRKGVT